jgi:hypothetical protein
MASTLVQVGEAASIIVCLISDYPSLVHPFREAFRNQGLLNHNSWHGQQMTKVVPKQN